jgi:hypothetical protein
MLKLLFTIHIMVKWYWYHIISLKKNIHLIVYHFFGNDIDMIWYPKKMILPTSGKTYRLKAGLKFKVTQITNEPAHNDTSKIITRRFSRQKSFQFARLVYFLKSNYNKRYFRAVQSRIKCIHTKLAGFLKWPYRENPTRFFWVWRENLNERFEQYINGSGKIFIQIFPSVSKKSCGKLKVRLL